MQGALTQKSNPSLFCQVSCCNIAKSLIDVVGGSRANRKLFGLSGNAGGTIPILVASGDTGSDGQFRLPIAREGRYRIRVTAPSFRPSLTDILFASGSGDIRVNVTLSVEALTQQITVTATGIPTPRAQIGAAISLLTPTEYPNMQDVHEALRLVPGLQATQTGQRGGTTSLFIRGGYGNYNKVLVDGIPASDVGGDVDFGNLALAGVDQIEVLRAPNSALYGADALAGVVKPAPLAPLCQKSGRSASANFFRVLALLRTPLCQR